MRHTLLLLTGVLLLSFSSCKENKDEVTEGLPRRDSVNIQERNKEIVKASMEGMKNADINIMMKDAAPDFKDYGDGGMQPMGLDSTKKMIGQMFTAFSDYKISNEEYYADGDKVLVYAEYSGTWSNDLMGMKASGKPFKTKDIDIFTLNKDGKVTEHRNVQNWACVLGIPAGGPAPTEEKKK